MAVIISASGKWRRLCNRSGLCLCSCARANVGVMTGYEWKELINLWCGGDPVPDTDSVLLFYSSQYCRGILRHFYYHFSHSQRPLFTKLGEWLTSTMEWIHYILKAIPVTLGSGSLSVEVRCVSAGMLSLLLSKHFFNSVTTVKMTARIWYHIHRKVPSSYAMLHFVRHNWIYEGLQ